MKNSPPLTEYFLYFMHLFFTAMRRPLWKTRFHMVSPGKGWNKGGWSNSYRDLGVHLCV